MCQLGGGLPTTAQYVAGVRREQSALLKIMRQQRNTAFRHPVCQSCGQRRFVEVGWGGRFEIYPATLGLQSGESRPGSLVHPFNAAYRLPARLGQLSVHPGFGLFSPSACFPGQLGFSGR